MSLFIFGLAGISVYVAKKNNRYTRQMLFLCFVTAMAIIFFVGNLLTTNINFAYFFSSLNYISMSWILSAYFQVMYILSKDNISSNEISIKFRVSYLIVLLIDSCHLLLNNIFHFSYEITPVCFENGELFYWNVQFGIIFYFHLLYCYIIAATIIVELVIRSMKADRFYRRRFVILLGYFLLLLLVNSFYYIFEWDFDYSIAGFFFLVFALFNYFYFQLPRESVDNMMLVVTGNISNGVACYDSDGNCLFKNNFAKRIFCEKEVGNVYAENYHENLMKRFPDIDYVTFEDTFNISDSKRVFNVTFQKQLDSRKRVITSFIKLEDKTDEINRYKKEKYNASHDRLTGLLNRSAFFVECERILKENLDVEYYLIATNIKDFKLLNDIFGMNFGDKVICSHSAQLASLTENCTVGRISGDRFGILIPKKIFNIQKGMESIRDLESLTKEMNYKLVVYYGVYEIANHYENMTLMYDKAVMAMENSADDSDKRFFFYTKGIMDKLLYRRNVISEFHSAIQSNQFIMYLQPQISRENKCLGAEALVRWQHPTLGLLSPAAFIEILESSGYVFELDRYVWEKAAEKLADWKSRGIDMYISVNISARDFYFADLEKVFCDLLEKYKIESWQMNLEITETALFYDTKLHKSILDKLKAKGFSIEMDDFGTGYSSLNTLKNIKVDVLKIDMGFLKKTRNTERSKVILASVLGMAKQLGMLVVVEGVETEEHFTFLNNIGCDIFQGYYFSKPVTVSAYEKKYIAGNIK